MFYQRFVSDGLAHYSYLVGDGGRGVVIDPHRSVDVYLAAAAKAGLEIVAVLETHRHEDFVVGSTALAQATGAPIWHADAHLDYAYGQAVRDGQTWQLGPLKLEAMHTPGHTLGSMSYVLRAEGDAPWMAFTGDLLFAGDVGRTDFYGEERLQETTGFLYDSLHRRVLPLGDGVLLCPAHGAGSACGASLADRELTTLGLERALNPQLQLPSREAFISEVARMLPFPPYFHGVEERNLRSAKACPSAVPTLAMEEVEASRARIVDLRGELAFASAHMPDALSMPPGTLGRYGGWFLEQEDPTVLVGAGATEAARLLCWMGYDHVLGELAGGVETYLRSGREPAQTRTASVQELCRLLDGDAKPWILDVRSDEERKASAIPDAQGIDLRYLLDRAGEVPQDRDVYVFCGSGRRAMVAVSLLQRLEDYGNLIVVLGGFAGWQSRSCPVKRSGA
ncbi:MAG: MBL fold metallo-hydrolase [Anaerolineae bacterium]